MDPAGRNEFAEKFARVNPRPPWADFPHTFAMKATQGKWKAFNYLRYISIEVAKAIVAGKGRIIITLPPRHGKSELISNWLPTWFLYNWPDRKIILASYAMDFAASWGAKVKSNLTENPLIQTSLSEDVQAKRRFKTLDGGQMISAGIGGPITGEGANLFIIDDPIKTWQDAMSDLIRERHKDWYKSVARTRLEPGGSIVVMHTRWHEDDLIGWLTSNKDAEFYEKWHVINLPAICEEEHDEVGRKRGDALNPERFPLTELEQIRGGEEGGLVWNALYQQRPSAMKGNVVLREWLRYYDIKPATFEEVAIFADLTYKEGTDNDFTVVQCWGRNGSNLFLLDQIRDRMGFPDQVKAIKEMCVRYPMAFAKVIEEAANGAAVIQHLKSEISGLIPYNPKTSKMARLAAVSPVFQAGNVFYPNPKFSPWVETNINELLTFPNAKHDDTVDATTMAVHRLGRLTSTIARLEAMNKF
jgi:predicted phage terminase large subunit-like protein